VKRKKLIIIIVVVILTAFILAVIYRLSEGGKLPFEVYSSQTVCEETTGKRCVFSQCDYNCPKGNYYKGWIATSRNYKPTPITWSENDCNELENELDEMLSSANHCKKDSDCKKINLGCPFGCYNLVNIDANTSDIAMAYSEFETNCNKCYFDCDRDPTPNEIKCINNSCVDTRYNSP
jgi:hypothetical protein